MGIEVHNTAVFDDDTSIVPPVLADAPATVCFPLSAGERRIRFPLASDGGDPATETTLAVDPDVSQEEWMSLDDETLSVSIAGFGAAPGSYVITATATNSAGSVQRSTTVDVVQPAVIGPAASSYNVQPGDSIQFSIPFQGTTGLVTVTGQPSWVTPSISPTSPLQFTAAPPGGTTPGTYQLTIAGSNCSSSDEITVDVVVTAAANCAPTTTHRVGTGGDLFTGGATLTETTCTTPDLTHASIASVLATSITAADVAAKRNNNNGTMAASIDVPEDGCQYVLNLVTMESFFTSAGSRVFDVLVNGVVRASAVDPYDDAGGAQCKAFAFSVPLDPGANAVTFANTANSAVIYFAEVECLGCTPYPTCPANVVVVQGQALSGLTATYTGAPTVTVSGEPAWVTATDDAAGTITFTGTAPGANEGPTTVTVETDDGVNDPVTCAFTIEVIDPVTDTPPTVTAPADQTVPAGQSLAGGLEFTVTDDGQSSVAIASSVTPTNGLIVVSETAPHTVTGSTTLAQEDDVYTVALSATDGAGSDNDSFTVTVGAPVTAPSGQLAATPGFDADIHLTSTMRGYWADFWSAYDYTPGTGDSTDPSYTKAARFYPRSMELMLALPLDSPRSMGSYSIARAWTFGLYGLIEQLRFTGDPRVLDELVYWSTLLRAHVGDWDGRGYDFIRYENPAGANQFAVNDDVNWLEECMMGCVLALLAYGLHVNRGLSSTYATEADYWFTYLDTLHVPKWLYRTHHSVVSNGPRGASPIFTAARAADLGLQNAIGWHPQGTDSATGTNPYNNEWGTHPLRHPVKDFAHPGIMNCAMFWMLHRWCIDTSYTPVGNWDLDAAEYLQQAVDVEQWFDQQSTDNADGSRDWWLKMNGTTVPSGSHQPEGNSGLISNGYSLHCVYFSHFFAREQWGHWADNAVMTRYRKGWWNPEHTTTNGVWAHSSGSLTRAVPVQYHFNNSSGGGTGKSVRSLALWAPWDDSGEFLAHIDWAINNSVHNHRNGDRSTQNGQTVNVIATNHNDPIHYCGLMSAEVGKP